jgi:hypothetical protein
MTEPHMPQDDAVMRPNFRSRAVVMLEWRHTGPQVSLRFLGVVPQHAHLVAVLLLHCGAPPTPLPITRQRRLHLLLANTFVMQRLLYASHNARIAVFGFVADDVVADPRGQTEMTIGFGGRDLGR